VPVIDRFLSLLQPGEKEKALRYHREEDRLRFVVGRGSLRYLLSGYLGQAPSVVRLAEGLNKKPYVETGAGPSTLHYNLSHAGDRVLIAIASSPVGVDIEAIDESFDFEELLPVGFSNKEAKLILQAANPREQFYRYWTRKEALLDEGLPEVPALDGSHQADAAAIGSVRSWLVNSFYPARGYIGSIAVDPRLPAIRYLRLPTIPAR
jgi:4'-phosphopantetheinyl transferase